MILADLIKGNKTAITLPPANANPAKVAKVDPVSAVLKPRLAGLATLALAESEQTDIFAPDYLDSGTPANDGKDLILYCADGDCWCSQKLPAADYPASCGACEYLDNPKQTKEQAETIPATFEQTGDPVTCPYWFQVCHAVSFYQDACTRCTDCQIFKFLKVNT